MAWRAYHPIGYHSLLYHNSKSPAKKSVWMPLYHLSLLLLIIVYLGKDIENTPHCTLLHHNRGVLDLPLHPEIHWTLDGITRWVQHGNQSGDHSKLDVSVVPPRNSLLAQRKKLKWHEEQPKSHVCGAWSNSFLPLKSRLLEYSMSH